MDRNSFLVNDLRTIALVDDLRKSLAETPWIAFKQNNTDPEKLGQYISALSNSARLGDQQFAYMLWGVRE